MFDLTDYPALIDFMRQYGLSLAWEEPQNASGVYLVQFFATKVSAPGSSDLFQRVQGWSHLRDEALNNYLKNIIGCKLIQEVSGLGWETICNSMPDLRPTKKPTEEPSRCMLVAQFL